MPEAAPQSIQQLLYPTMTCFGCGPGNPRGLGVASFPPTGDATVTASFTPWPEHDNGFGYLNGGIISTLLDCHSAAAAVWAAYERGWMTADGPVPYVTAGLDVRYRRPSPLHDTVELTAVVTEAGAAQMTTSAELVFAGRTCASATAVWKRWRPR
ncbi:MAG TPA: PaaI family thioesterase [Jatrophihabitans sp.]|nr:PaaI family thioesterase [Jatrophihabitans sp.]